MNSLFFLTRLFASIYLLSAISILPYNCYITLRFAVCIVASYGVYRAFTKDEFFISGVFLLTAILFNPIFPFHFSKNTWIILDLLSAFFFLISILLLDEPFLIKILLEKQLKAMLKTIVLLVALLIGSTYFLGGMCSEFIKILNINRYKNTTQGWIASVEDISDEEEAFAFSIEYIFEHNYEEYQGNTTFGYNPLYDENTNSLLPGVIKQNNTFLAPPSYHVPIEIEYNNRNPLQNRESHDKSYKLRGFSVPAIFVVVIVILSWKYGVRKILSYWLELKSEAQKTTIIY